MLKLGEFGIKGLPDAIGGPYTVKEHLAWMQERFLIEGGRYKELAMPATHMNALMRAPVPAASHNSTFVPEQNENINLVQVAAATEHAINFGLQEFAQALDQIPHGAKASYMQAMQQAPELVERESNPAAFLRREAFDAAAAARRLVKYWEVRVTIFEEKAFMPLNQTGEGALDRRDLAVLGTAYFKSLPNDSQGRSVLFCDGSRLARSTRQSRLRTTFYLYSIASESKLSQSSGFILLHLITEPSFERANKECLDLVLSAIPSAIHDVHLLRVTDSPLETEVDPAVLHQYRQVARHQVIPHINTSRNLLAPRLARYGLDTEHLPKSIGGKFGFDRFFQWQELRTRYEWGLPAGVGNKASADMFGFGKEKPLGDLTE
jgi:hypothetical protein